MSGNSLVLTLVCLSGFRVSGCVDHFAKHERDAYECTRNIISTLNYELPREEDEERWNAEEEPLHGGQELLQLAPLNYNHSLDARMVSHDPRSRALCLKHHHTHCRINSECQKRFIFFNYFLK